MIFKRVIWEHEQALLYKNGKFIKMLSPGPHYFIWFSGNTIFTYDKREQNLSLSAQEILTQDKISSKFTLQLKYQIKDAKKFHLSANDPLNNFYLMAQETLRRSIEQADFEEILENRKQISEKITEGLSVQAEKIGLHLINAFLKDIILPAHLKESFSRALENKKIAQAALAATREQIANARGLKNLADIYKNEPILLKLLELQTAKEVGENGGTVVFGNANSKPAI